MIFSFKTFFQEMSRNTKTIDNLMKIAKTTEESIFQRNKEYVKLKAKKNINITDIDLILGEFYHLDYHEEKIYWNKRALEEKICDKEKRYHFFRNLIQTWDSKRTNMMDPLKIKINNDVDGGFPNL